jgi:glycosyltransferase involved in cell wall biosynthesis
VSLPRVVLVTRRFWPLVGGAEIMAARLAAGLKERGAATTLITARWQNDWPAEIEQHGVRVLRLAQPQTRLWGTWRYMQSVGRWLMSHRSQFDIVYVSMLKHDAYAAVTAAQTGGFPVVLRAEGAGLTGDCHWQLEANCGARIKRRCRQADAFVAPSPAIERELIVSGYARGKIHYVPNGVAIPEGRDAARRSQARADLAQADPSLAIGDAPLVVYTGRLHKMKGLDDLVRAWPRVLERLPEARLWLVGDGPHRAELSALVDDLGLWGFVYVTGPFDDVDEFLQAADLFVLPSLEEGMSLALLEAMALGLAVVASAIPANEAVVQDAVHGRLVPTGDSARLADVMIELLADRAQAERLGRAARERVCQEYSLDRMVDEHLRLFERLLANKR